MGMDISLYIQHNARAPWNNNVWQDFKDPDKKLNWGILERRKSQVQDALFNGIDGIGTVNNNQQKFPPHFVEERIDHYAGDQLFKRSELQPYYTWFKPMEFIDYYEKHKDILDADEVYIEFGKERHACYLIKSFVEELKKLNDYDSLDNFRIIYYMG